MQENKKKICSNLVLACSGCFLFLHTGHRNFLKYMFRKRKQIAKQLEVHPSTIPIMIVLNSQDYLCEKLESVELPPSSFEYGEELGRKILAFLTNEISAMTRYARLVYFTKKYANVIITIGDNVVPHVSPFSLGGKAKTIWFAGSEYESKIFPQRSLVDEVVVYPEKATASSSLLIETIPAMLESLTEKNWMNFNKMFWSIAHGNDPIQSCVSLSRRPR